jgi:hypothetical protein
MLIDRQIGKNYYLKGNGMIRHINSFGPKNAGDIKDIPPSSSIHSNLYQHKLSLCKWRVSNILNLKK